MTAKMKKPALIDLTSLQTLPESMVVPEWIDKDTLEVFLEDSADEDSDDSDDSSDSDSGSSYMSDDSNSDGSSGSSEEEQ